jgi:hypothetical protein
MTPVRAMVLDIDFVKTLALVRMSSLLLSLSPHHASFPYLSNNHQRSSYIQVSSMLLLYNFFKFRYHVIIVQSF